MPNQGWKQLLGDLNRLHGEGRFPIAAYSEFIPPPRLGCKPSGWVDPFLFDEEDPWGWHVMEWEQAFELRPGMDQLAQQIVHSLVALGRGEAAHGISKHKLDDNAYWPQELSRAAGKLRHEHYLVLAPLALGRTQDDKGRVRWTLFGGSEQGPWRAFWKSFFTAPGKELPADQALDFFRHLLTTVYDESADQVVDLRTAGLRILPEPEQLPGAAAKGDRLPSWTKPLLLEPRERLKQVKYLLTFRPFGELPAPVRKAYLAGELHLLPFPGSLVFWGVESFHRLAAVLPLAEQIPLLHSICRHENPLGIRVPQSGWMHEPRADGVVHNGDHGPFRDTYKRTHRWQRAHRDEDELESALTHEDKVAHVLFSTAPEDLGLYGKPMARNAQLWTHEFAALLDGPRARPKDLLRAREALSDGGLFGYRFQFPTMQVGMHEVYWHRPLVAYWSEKQKHAAVLNGGPLGGNSLTGYFTAYTTKRPNLAKPIELWPRMLAREWNSAAIELFHSSHDRRPHQAALNARRLLDASRLQGGEPLRRSLARQVLTLPRQETLETFFDRLPREANDPRRGAELLNELRSTVRAEDPPLSAKRSAKGPPSLTFAKTARRPFEVAYWKTIASLAEGKYINKDNADCVSDPATAALLAHPQRDLDALGDYLIAYYQRIVTKLEMQGKVLVGDLPFSWQTDFNYGWSGGWLGNQQGHLEERDIMVVIPGRDRRRAVIMADHYDTAYMEDIHDKDRGGSGARVSAAGADDNHSATSALMLGAPIFMELSRKGLLACDVWLVHLTGEEFPSDCMGARYLTQQVIQRTLKIRLPKNKFRDLSKTRVQGVYVSDMIAHNNDKVPDVFQISPGTSRTSLWLAAQAHLATETWNASVDAWNARPERVGCERGVRSPEGSQIPEIARHPRLSGEVRLPYDPRSTLYNTDGQIFSDAGIPVVLFMENYDINRSGYHDTHDTMANIDLDYGSAVAAIVIESVARAATETPPE
jgi:hypothetical protein